MPYRRLPNTDQARLRALQKSVRETRKHRFEEPIISYKTLHEAETFLPLFEKQLILYNQSLENQINNNTKYQHIINNARTYISHFIQVFNLSVIRGEIKKEYKTYYELDEDIHHVPDLSTEANILFWGEKIIYGENYRLNNGGGTPIYNPSIAKVQVHFEIFKTHKAEQKIYQSTTTHNREKLSKMREKADDIILSIWNQVEKHFQKDESAEARIAQCKAYGVIYYYRRSEKKEK